MAFPGKANFKILDVLYHDKTPIVTKNRGSVKRSESRPITVRTRGLKHPLNETYNGVGRCSTINSLKDYSIGSRSFMVQSN